MLSNTNQDANNNYDEAYNFLERSEIDPDQPDIRFRLEDIQGNILKSHGRTYSIYVFLHFDNSQPEATKKWIGDFAEKYVVSAIRQREQTQEHKKFLKTKKEASSSTLFVNFSLSFKGYEALGLDAKTNFRKLYQQKLQDKERSFSTHPFEEGMLENLESLKDKKRDWEIEYQQVESSVMNNDIHALILLADCDIDNLCEKTQQILDNIEANNIRIIKKEIGWVRKNDQDQCIEPFGFADNISNPLFLKSDIYQVTDKDQWDPSANLRLVLNVDPFGNLQNKGYSYGSFLVYRKLEQNVEGFNEKIKELAGKLENLGADSHPKKETEQLVKAYTMGRFQNGRPVMIYSSPDSLEQSGVDLNNFNYGKGNDFKETSRWKCPFHAHIRKMNSRAISDNVHSGTYKDKPDNQRQRRIVRRGTTYGLPKENQTSLLSQTTKENLRHYKSLSEKLGVKTEVGKEGLLFFCFQSDIHAQFEKLQDYANDNNFGTNPFGKLGADPILGQQKTLLIQQVTDRILKIPLIHRVTNSILKTPLIQWGREKLPPMLKEAFGKWPSQTWPRTWGNSQDPVKDFDFFGYVTPRGGEYFFTPSLSFLKSLKEE
jgi:deferrochelatase/peroxidase EfeB